MVVKTVKNIMWDLSYWLAGFGPLVVPIQNQETMGIHEWLQGHPYRPIITRSCPGHYVKDSGESCKFFHQIISHWLCGWLHINIKNPNKKLPTYPGNKRKHTPDPSPRVDKEKLPNIWGLRVIFCGQYLWNQPLEAYAVAASSSAHWNHAVLLSWRWNLRCVFSST